MNILDLAGADAATRHDIRASLDAAPVTAVGTEPSSPAEGQLWVGSSGVIKARRGNAWVDVKVPWGNVTGAPSYDGGFSVVAASPPSSPVSGMEWVDSTTGRTFTWFITNTLTHTGTWVELFGGSSYPATTIIAETSDSHNVSNADLGNYVRMTATTAKTVFIPAASGAFAPIDSAVITIHNTGTGDTTVTPQTGVTLVPSGSANIPTGATWQAMQVGTNMWEVL